MKSAEPPMPMTPLTPVSGEAFREELEEDAAAGGAEGFAQADFAGALGDRDQHDVDDADSAEAEGDKAHAAEEDVHGVKDFADHLLGLNGIPLVEGVAGVGVEAVTAADDLVNFVDGGECCRRDVGWYWMEVTVSWGLLPQLRGNMSIMMESGM